MMKLFGVLLLHTLLSVAWTETFFDPNNKGQEKIENVHISNVTDTHATLEWDYHGIRELLTFRLITEPPIAVYDGEAYHPTTSVLDPKYRYFKLKPDTEYNVTIRAEADYSAEKFVAFSEMVSFKTKPSIPEITFHLVNGTSSDYTILCVVRGIPLPDANITHNGEPLEVETTGDGLILLHTQLNVTVSSYGTYTCNAANKAGTVTKDIQLAYSDDHAHVLVETMDFLLKKTEQIEKNQETRMNQMEGSLGTMNNHISEIKQLLQSKPVVN